MSQRRIDISDDGVPVIVARRTKEEPSEWRHMPHPKE
jgi:hypothetical protein